MNEFSTGPTPVLEAESLHKSYGDISVLADVSLAVMPGQILVVRGANGTGKSTLLRCITGRESPSSGTVEFQGRALWPDDPAVLAAMGVALGGSAFLDLTVNEHLDFTARAHGNSNPGPLVEEVMGEFDLLRVRNHFPSALSQGQRRRLSLAGCLVRPRQLLVLDEPEANLDDSGRNLLAVRLLRERAEGTAIVIACHDAGLAERIADLELVLEHLEEDGEYLEEDSVDPRSDGDHPDADSAV